MIKRYLNVIRPTISGSPEPPTGFTVYYGHNSPVPPETVQGLALEAHDEMAQFLKPGTDILTWESYAVAFQANPYPVPVDLPLNGIDMQFVNYDNFGLGPFYEPSTYSIVSDTAASGRYNTTTGGVNFLQDMATTELGGPDEGFALAVVFDPHISAFGAYFTDLGDFLGSFTLRLVKSDDTFTDYILTDGIEDPVGMLTYWGFLDTADTYKQIIFYCSAGLVEFFGMDDIVYGPVGVIVGQ